MLAILGGDVKSPGCAVHIADDGTVLNESGMFSQTLLAELRQREIEIPIRGIRDSSEDTLAEDLEWLEQLLSRTADA